MSFAVEAPNRALGTGETLKHSKDFTKYGSLEFGSSERLKLWRIMMALGLQVLKA